MSIQFKIAEGVSKAERDKLLAALNKAGLKAAPLFPNQRRAALATIYTIEDAAREQLDQVQLALRPFTRAVEYIEEAPKRSLPRPRQRRGS